MAMSRAKALSMAASSTKARGSGPPALAISTMRRAAARQRSLRRGSTAGMVPLPGSARPSASQRQFIELAVNIPEQEPQPGQEVSSMASSCFSVMVAFLYCATASKTVFRSEAAPVTGLTPGSIGPPEAKMVGIFTRNAAKIMPGTILSQLGMQMTPSKQCARNMVSTESAISSRLGRLIFIPSWPMAMPSQTAMVSNSKGTPPAARISSLTSSLTARRWQWPGTMSVYDEQTAMKGLPKSSRFTPAAKSKERWGAR